MNNHFFYHDDKKTSHNHGLYDLNDALAKGTLYKNIYIPYKYDPAVPIPENEKDQQMLDIQSRILALTDLNLYLDIFPNNKESIALYNKILEELKIAINKYEEKYGVLTTFSQTMTSAPWKWNENNWSWAVKNNVDV